MPARDTSGLALGTPTRLARSALRRALGNGEVVLAALLLGACAEEHERAALGMTIGALLEAAPQTRNRVAATATAAGVELHVRLRDLTTAGRQRLAVACDWTTTDGEDA